MSTLVKGIIGVTEVVVGAYTGQAWLVGMGVATLLGTAASLFTPGHKSGGLQTQIAYDPAYPRQLIVGRTITAGSLVAQFTHDSLPGGGGNEGKNRVLELVIALGDHECDGLEQIIVNGQIANVGSFDSVLGNPITTTLNPVSGQTSVDYTGKLWVMVHTGANSQTVDAHLHSVMGSQWPTTAVGTNVCYARVTAVYDAALFGGIPQVQFVLRGAKLYDPRLDSSVGGSGSQRFGTASTYVWTDNLAVIAYNLVRGIYVGGQLFFGAGAADAEVPFSVSVAAMNACDELVSLKAGGTEKRYTGGGQTAVSRDAQAFLKQICDGMAGYIGTGGGSIAILPGVAQTPVVSFTDDDIMAREPYEHAPKFGFDSLKNTVFGTFLNPSLNWSRDTLPLRTSSSDITADGGTELLDSYSLDAVNSNTQGQRVMEIFRRRNRRQIAQTVTLRPSAFVVERGDWVQWTSAQWGYSAKTFFVANIAISPNLNIVLGLIEVDSTIFSWIPANDELPPSGGLLPSADPPASLQAAGFVASPLTEVNGIGSSVGRVQFAWTDPLDPTVRGVLIEYRQVGSTVSSYVNSEDVSAGFAQLDAQLLPGANYEARMIFQALVGRPVTWTGWQSFIFPAAVIMPAGIDPVSSLLQKALSPASTVRQSVATQIYFPWLDTMEAAFAATAKAATDLESVRGVVRDAGIVRDAATGTVTISAVNAVNTDLQSYKSTVTATFNAVNASIALNVTTTTFNQGIAAVAAGFTPAYRYEFNTAVDGWTASNATLSASASILTYTGTGASPYLQSPTLALNAAANPLVQIKLSRSAGSTWGMSVVWGSSYQFSQTVTVPTDPTVSNVVQADMTGNANWTGTITGIRIALGDASTVYLIDYVAIGQSAIQALVVGDLTTRVTNLESTVSLQAGQISLLATSATVSGINSRLTTAEGNISANTASIALKASQSDLTTTNTTLSTVQLTLNAQQGQIEQVLAFASGQTAVGLSASPEQMAANIAASLAGLVTKIAQLETKLEYARQGIYADVGTESAARVQAVLQLQATIQNTQASLLAINSTFADGISAEAVQRVAGDATLTATIGTLPGGASTVAAAFTNELNARVSGDAANASSITALSAYFGAGIDATHTVAAAITNEASVRASADSANASNISTLTTTVNGHTTSISTITSSVNGLNAQWGVQINVNGAVTGLVRLDSGSTQSSFTVVANNFSYYDPTNGATPLFTITGGIAYFSAPLVAGIINATTLIASNVIIGSHVQSSTLTGTHLQSNTLQTAHLQAAQVTDFDSLDTPTSGISTGEVNPWGSTARVVVGIDSSSKVLLTFSGSFTRAGGTSPVVAFRIYRAGSPNTLLAQSMVGGSGVAENESFVVVAVDKTPTALAGNGHYFATSIILSGTTSPAAFNDAVLSAFVGKR